MMKVIILNCITNINLNVLPVVVYDVGEGSVS